MKPLRIDTLRAFFYSLAIHGLAAGLLMLSVNFDSFRMPVPSAPTKLVQAVAVDQRHVEAEIKRIRDREEQTRREQQARERKLQDELEKAKQARAAEEQRLAKIKQERETLERKKREEEQRLKEVEVKRKREEETQKKAEAERKRVEEQKQKQAEEEKRKLAEETARRAEEQRKQEEALRQQELLDAIAAEERETARAQQDARDQDLIDRYIQQITLKIESAFINPAPKSKLSCVIRIRMIPGGEVVSAAIEQSSGNPAFDRQAAVAVEKASPLPVPDDPRLFNQFRELPIFFNPTQ